MRVSNNVDLLPNIDFNLNEKTFNYIQVHSYGIFAIVLLRDDSCCVVVLYVPVQWNNQLLLSEEYISFKWAMA